MRLPKHDKCVRCNYDRDPDKIFATNLKDGTVVSRCWRCISETKDEINLESLPEDALGEHPPTTVQDVRNIVLHKYEGKWEE